MRYLPLYEAKMFHQFDHRFGTYAGAADGVETEPEPADEEEAEEGGGGKGPKTRPCTLEEKRDPHFLPEPRYWVSEYEVLMRAVPLSREEKKLLEKMDPERVVELLRPRAPKWLVAYRRIVRSTDVGSTIATIAPCIGFGDPSPVIRGPLTASESLVFISILNSLVLGFGARSKIGGIHLDAFHLYQTSFLSPDQLPRSSHALIVPRALELVYTSWHLRPLAEEVCRSIGLEACRSHGWKISGFEPFDLEPFPFDEERRAVLRAELDALVARLYGLNRKQLRYILCPQGLSWAELRDVNDGWEDPTCSGPHCLPAEPALDFPGETFRVMQEKEEKKYGEYRTRRLVLEAWQRFWEELGPVEPLPVRFGPNAPASERPRRQPSAPPPAPVATGLFAAPSPAPTRPQPPRPEAPAPPRDDEEGFTLVPPEPAQPKPLRDKEGRIVRVRVVGASGQEVVSAGTVVGKRKVGEAAEYTVLVDATGAVKKFLSPPAKLFRLKEE